MVWSSHGAQDLWLLKLKYICCVTAIHNVIDGLYHFVVPIIVTGTNRPIFSLLESRDAAIVTVSNRIKRLFNRIITNCNHETCPLCEGRVFINYLNSLNLCEELLFHRESNACQPDKEVNVSLTLEGIKTILSLVYLTHLHLVYYTTVHWYLTCPGLPPAGQ